MVIIIKCFCNTDWLTYCTESPNTLIICAIVIGQTCINSPRCCWKKTPTRTVSIIRGIWLDVKQQPMTVYNSDLLFRNNQTNNKPILWIYYSSIHAIVRQSFNCEGLGITYTDSLLIGGEFTEDMVSVGWTDPHLREGCKFLRHLIQQSPHLQ